MIILKRTLVYLIVSALDEGETLGGLLQAGLEMRDLRRAPWWIRLWRCLGGQL